MGVSVYLKGDYEDFHALSRQKNKAYSKPILFSPQIYLGVLKKQSQLAGGKIDAKSYVKGNYEETAAVWAAKNKAKQSQFFRSAF